MQGATLPIFALDWEDESGNARTLNGTLTGYLVDKNGGATAIDGTLAADGDQVANQGRFTWTPSAADVATAGVYEVYFIETVGGKAYKSIPVELTILDAPT